LVFARSAGEHKVRPYTVRDMTRDSSQRRYWKLPRNFICQFIVNISIYSIFQFAKTTEQQHVPRPLQRSRAGAVFSEDAGRLCE
ncbi:MAG: hypothetical protein SWH68_11630, partial [Thermodesulfobacteriota bacterium]|nr:hypothetical protein [Thermodesulfobacteriota bacterium]